MHMSVIMYLFIDYYLFIVFTKCLFHLNTIKYLLRKIYYEKILFKKIILNILYINYINYINILFNKNRLM